MEPQEFVDGLGMGSQKELPLIEIGKDSTVESLQEMIRNSILDDIRFEVLIGNFQLLWRNHLRRPITSINSVFSDSLLLIYQ